MAFDPVDDTVFDDTLSTAVSLFQRANGLAVTGEVDDVTLDLMRRPRCGFPDDAGGADQVDAGARRCS